MRAWTFANNGLLVTVTGLCQRYEGPRRRYGQRAAGGDVEAGQGDEAKLERSAPDCPFWEHGLDIPGYPRTGILNIISTIQ
jgi:hypothetical protein